MRQRLRKHNLPYQEAMDKLREQPDLPTESESEQADSSDDDLSSDSDSDSGSEAAEGVSLVYSLPSAGLKRTVPSALAFFALSFRALSFRVLQSLFWTLPS